MNSFKLRQRYGSTFTKVQDCENKRKADLMDRLHCNFTVVSVDKIVLDCSHKLKKNKHHAEKDNCPHMQTNRLRKKPDARVRKIIDQTREYLSIFPRKQIAMWKEKRRVETNHRPACSSMVECRLHEIDGLYLLWWHLPTSSCSVSCVTGLTQHPSYGIWITISICTTKMCIFQLLCLLCNWINTEPELWHLNYDIAFSRQHSWSVCIRLFFPVFLLGDICVLPMKGRHHCMKYDRLVFWFGWFSK